MERGGEGPISIPGLFPKWLLGWGQSCEAGTPELRRGLGWEGPTARPSGAAFLGASAEG